MKQIMERSYDMFMKMGDRRDIVEFVKEVEKYPCLYDKTIPEYANKVHNRRAWSTIAKKANTTVPDCRDRWRKIRISFMRSLKQQQSDKPPMRPYYLTEELKFLQPFISINPQTPPREGKQLQSPITDKKMEFEVGIEKQEISDDSSFDLEIDTNENAQEISRISFNETMPNNNRIENGHVMQNGRNAHNNVYSDDIENNPRKMFLLSMLPDIGSLTEAEMRIFRREVISIIDNIILNRST